MIPAEIPDFTGACRDLADLRKAVEHSLDYLKKPSSRQSFPCGPIGHQDAVDSLKAFAELIDSGYRGARLNSLIRERFDVYMSVGCDGRGTVLFTGYYTPVFEGSRKPGGRFKYPVYGLPEDLVKDTQGVTVGRRSADGGIVPYPSRAEIERSGLLKGKEIMWLTDPFEVYIAHVQGSARIRLPDGSLTGIGYVANNGHEYKSIMQRLIDDGKIGIDRLSLSAAIAYFKSHPDETTAYTDLNPRFVFFREHRGTPVGSLNRPVTKLRTIATDKSIYPRGCLAFLTTVLPSAAEDEIIQRPYAGFALDQDAGGAIRAPGRCDVYMGEGEQAGKSAGKTFSEGRLYYLFLKKQP